MLETFYYMYTPYDMISIPENMPYVYASLYQCQAWGWVQNLWTYWIRSSLISSLRRIYQKVRRFKRRRGRNQNRLRENKLRVCKARTPSLLFWYYCWPSSLINDNKSAGPLCQTRHEEGDLNARRSRLYVPVSFTCGRRRHPRLRKMTSNLKMRR